MWILRLKPAAFKVQAWSPRRYSYPGDCTSERMDVKVLLFASLRELAGVRELVVHLEEAATTSDLKLAVAAQLPVLANGMQNITLAVNKAYVLEAVQLKNGDEVALLPPISGG